MEPKLKEMESKIMEIIRLSEERLERGDLSERNKFVVGAILREFNEIHKYLIEHGKLLLCAVSLPIATRWTIIDSADFDNQADNYLFDKVRNFNKECKIIEGKYKIYTDPR